MNEYLPFVPLWVLGFLIGFYAKQINQLLDEPRAIVINTNYEDDEIWQK